MQLLDITDPDEVSPVKAGANRRGIVLKEDQVAEDAEIADIMSIPWEREGAMIDEIRKAGSDETVVKGAVAAMRLLNGIADELPEEMQEAVAKLGSELYSRQNPKLNTSDESAVPGEPGGLTGSASGAPQNGSGSGPGSKDGSGRDGELSGTASGVPTNKDDSSQDDDYDDDCDDMDDDGVMKDGKEPYGNVTYADPGYQQDGKKRYPLDSEKHIRAAWSYINMPKNASKYSSSQVAAIKSRIKSKMKGLGADISKTSIVVTGDGSGITSHVATVSKEDEAIAKELMDAEAAVLPEGWTFHRLFKAFRKSQGERPHGADDPSDDGETSVPDPEPDSTDDNAIAKGGPVEAHEVPIQKADGTWDLSGVPDATRPFYETVLKAQAETAEKLEKAETELAETREALRVEGIIAKAEKEFTHIGAKDDVVEVLKAGSEKLDADGYERLVNLLSAADERIAKSSLMDELGRSSFESAPAGDAWDKIEKAADDLVQKGADGMTREQAIDTILKSQQGKVWYGEYLAETGVGRVS